MSDSHTQPVDDTDAPSTQPVAQPVAHPGRQHAPRTVARPDAADLRSVIDDLMVRFGALPDSAWEQPATELTWTCRETVAHLFDDFGFYAMQLAGSHPPQDSYVDILDPPAWRDGGPQIVFWPDPAAGTRGIVGCLDAVGGLLVAVVATAPPERRGFHPRGVSDRTGFAAMGIVEAMAHGYDILSAHGVDYSPDDEVCRAVLARLFRTAARSEDPWHDLLAATGRTPETRGERWTWDSTV